MRVSNTLTDLESAVYKLSAKIGVVELYRSATRNDDKNIRDSFKINSNVVGSREWAICKCMGIMSNQINDSDCEKIISVLENK